MRTIGKVVYIDGAMPGLKVGGRVAYTGDVCNRPRTGTVTAVWEDRWGHFFDLTCDAEHPDEKEPEVMRGLSHGVFGGLSPRFVTLGSVELGAEAQKRLDILIARWGCSAEVAVRRALILAEEITR